MREVKFRAWHKADKRMFGVYQINWEQGGLTISCGGSWHEDVDNYELMQFTGLKDENGVEICEGDVIRDDDESYNLIVVWDNKRARFALSDGKGSMFTYMFNNDMEPLEIIGNIYENPELVK